MPALSTWRSQRLPRTPRRGRALALLLAAALPLPGLAASCPEADPEALEWLDKMSRSSHHTAYHGVVTLQRGEDMQVMQISHSVSGGASSEQLTKLTGQGAQVVREEHPLNCVHTGHRLLQLGARLESGECGVASYYRFQVAPGERIAGRKAVQVRVEPRDMYRYGYLLELDRETGLLLRSSTLGRGDLVLERFQFANLSFGAPMPSSGDIDVVYEAGHPTPSLDTGEVGVTWTIGWLPRGFAPTESGPAVSGRRTYTDGLAAFSVFLEPLSRDIRSGEGVAREGSTTSYTRGLSLSGQPVLVTVIGEVPVNTARMVADSVRWTP
ncbi:MucB/RseB C-terminal domain-containing protein [Parahaliea mediterranea]|uniref:MucB/RseB C-terminal domain-containing protein n=1 Tax=Parahaliea mediterranea TaxID=651086 RepID=A0A939IJY4_9GAMM|nr:MucB/RseB C-terminal domain-containing protein [Parahaliea mediterranea]MBN7798179.1 MucB/RseB C-terminal domain-containing protein [Parahaliea mediterranea]